MKKLFIPMTTLFGVILLLSACDASTSVKDIIASKVKVSGTYEGDLTVKLGSTSITSNLQIILKQDDNEGKVSGHMKAKNVNTARKFITTADISGTLKEKDNSIILPFTLKYMVPNADATMIALADAKKLAGDAAALAAAAAGAQAQAQAQARAQAVASVTAEKIPEGGIAKAKSLIEDAMENILGKKKKEFKVLGNGKTLEWDGTSFKKK